MLLKLIAKAIKDVYKPDESVCQNGWDLTTVNTFSDAWSYQDIKSVRLLSFIWYNQEKQNHNLEEDTEFV